MRNYLYIAIACARTSCNGIIIYIRLCVMSMHNRQKRNAEDQLRRCQNPAYRKQKQVEVADMEQRQIAPMNHENRTQEQVIDTEQR
jgi:hypothetical protein